MVEPLNPTLFLPCNVQNDEEIKSTFEIIQDKWDSLDILIHCLAFAKKDDLTGDFSQTSREGFRTALEVSTYSLVQLAGAAKPLMTAGGSIVTLTYLFYQSNP